MKIVGIGLNKTGTKTLGTCMRMLGYKHASCSMLDFELWCGGRVPEILSRMEQFDSYEDWPWPLIYREIDARFPGSKFIFTRRPTAEAWYHSLCRHAEQTGPTLFRSRIYGHAMPFGNKEAHIAFYNRHAREIREYFAGRPDAFVEVCWDEGDAWEALSTFLQVEHPPIPFPHVNKNSSVLNMDSRSRATRGASTPVVDRNGYSGQV